MSNMVRFLGLVFAFFACFTLQAQTILNEPKVYFDGGLSYNVVDAYHYNLMGDLTDLPIGLFSLRVNAGVRGDVKLGSENRIGARIRAVYLGYGYKEKDVSIVEIPLEVTWTIFQELPLYFFAGYCIPVADGLGGADFGVHAEYKSFFLEVAPKIDVNSAFGLSVMLGYSYQYVWGS